MFRNTRQDQDQDQRPRRRLSYANVVATMAVFLAIGGGAAFAASTLPANSVNSKTVQDNKLKSVDLKDGKAVSTDDVIDASLTGTDIADASVTGTDVADNSLTGDDVDESTLGQVPDAAKLQGKSATQFLSSSVYKRESAVDAGQQLGDGTFVKGHACDPGDVLLSGGPANINATSTLLESFPSPGTTNGWSARINKNNQTDNWSVVILCVDQ
jgi:hypothetical protein